MREHRIAGFSLIALFAMLAGMLIADIPAEKKEISIDHLEGNKGAVKFDHSKHAMEYKVDGKAIACTECHHTAKSDSDKMVACSECHSKDGTEKTVDGKKAPPLGEKSSSGNVKMSSVLMHDTCRDCHKKVKEKKISSCKVCHP